jgi:hypothetical protein
MDDYPEPRFFGYVGMPRALYLKMYAEFIDDIFDTNIYLVGSALKRKNWKDIDVVAVLSDQRWESYGFGDPQKRFYNKRWAAYCMSLSSFGKQLIGCEVDFQIHQESYTLIHEGDPKLLIG